MNKNSYIGIRVEDHIKVKLEKLAAEKKRSISNFLQLLIEAAIDGEFDKG